MSPMEGKRDWIWIKLKKPRITSGSPYFYLVWEFIIGGKKYSRGANFPFSLS